MVDTTICLFCQPHKTSLMFIFNHTLHIYFIGNTLLSKYKTTMKNKCRFTLYIT